MLWTLWRGIGFSSDLPPLVERPWTWLLAAGVAVSAIGIFVLLKRRQELGAFLASAAFLVSLLAATAAGLFPTLLTSTVNPAYSLNAQNSSAGGIGLQGDWSGGPGPFCWRLRISGICSTRSGAR